MQGIANAKLRERLERFNSPNYTYLKVLFRQLAVYLIFFTVGVLGFYFLEIPFQEKTNAYISGHFSYLFEGCEGFFDYFRSLIECSSLDAWHMVFIFVAGFTAFSFFACSLACAYRGLSFGFSVGYAVLAAARNEISVAHFELAFFVYLALNVLIAALFISFSARSVLFSYDYRRALGKRRTLYSFLLAFLACLGFVIIINLIRCIFSVIYIF